MISIYRKDKSRLDDELYVIVEFRGLSSDTKPTVIKDNKGIEKKVDNGSVFIEIDTGKIFFYDLIVSEVRTLKIDVQFVQKDVDLQALYTALALAYLESLKK